MDKQEFHKKGKKTLD